MKRTLRTLMSLLVAVNMMFLPISQTVSAQDNRAVYEEIIEVNQAIESLAGTFDIAVSADIEEKNILDMKATGDFQVQLASEVEAAGNVAINGTVLDTSYDSETDEVKETTESFNHDVDFVLKDSTFYYQEDDEWLSRDVQTQVQEFQRAYQEALKQQSEMSQEDLVAFYEKYYTLEETDEGLVMSLQDNVDVDELKADLEAMMDMEAYINQAIEEQKAVFAEQGIEFTQEMEDYIRQGADQSIAQAFDAFSLAEVTYDKDTKLVKKIVAKVDVDDSNLAEMNEAMNGEGVPSIPFAISFEMTLTFDQHGESFNIEAPENATPVSEESMSVAPVDSVDSVKSIETDESVEESEEEVEAESEAEDSAS
ncbi:hypothetical protein CL176_11595 [Suicoccus acidiformans]|uniref:Uncharacterized protein n=1 Tax=Suicoccus acidiformans TaxID=2036206 RepID=A0A347WND3_9LACT|nr:hypothetical protein [Suicoccus acidiformans]AXY26590.1 hypothetical protein CL176_11595 [Suicoccus acidiformans]